MGGIIDRILNGNGPRPLDVDTAAAMLSTTPGLLREFERSYHANVLDRKEAPIGPSGPDAGSVIASRSGHDLSDAALALDARIVRELLADTGVIRFDGERLTAMPTLAPVPEQYVTEADVNALQPGERPQLAGELIHRQIDAVNYPLLLDMWRHATDPKRSAKARREAYGMFRTGLDDDTRAALIEAGRNVLAARANHPGQSLADLYDPDYMPTDLRAAHRELDKIADVAFGAGKWLKDDDDTRLKILFDSYARMTAERG